MRYILIYFLLLGAIFNKCYAEGCLWQDASYVSHNVPDISLQASSNADSKSGYYFYMELKKRKNISIPLLLDQGSSQRIFAYRNDNKKIYSELIFLDDNYEISTFLPRKNSPAPKLVIVTDLPDILLSNLLIHPDPQELYLVCPHK